jgi:hypothetical protein
LGVSRGCRRLRSTPELDDESSLETLLIHVSLTIFNYKNIPSNKSFAVLIKPYFKKAVKKLDMDFEL